jgi:tetratricopeptide (TPR) repeat protein
MTLEPDDSAVDDARLDEEQPDQSAEAEPMPVAEEPPAAAVRTIDARLARLHLRGGLLTLARAELEQMAGAGTLDREALADLAESRWRSGDLEGAFEAAQAHLANDGDEPLAHLIVAEALYRHGHLIDARAHSGPVVERLGDGVDRLFAGEPRSTAWPVVDGAQMFSDANQPGRRGLLVGGADATNMDAARWEPAAPPAALPDRRSPVTSQTGAFAARAASDAWARSGNGQGVRPAALGAPVGPGSSMRELLDAGRAAGLELADVEQQIESGDLDGVADRLGLLLRMDRALSPVILTLADRVVATSQGDEARLVSLHMLRGDIYRGLGRDVEATAAYQQAMRAVSPRAPAEEPS